MDDLPKSLLWCYDDDRQWFLVALYLALISSSFFEIFIFFFFLRITFFDPSPIPSDVVRTRIRDAVDSEHGHQESKGYPRRRISNAQTAAVTAPAPAGAPEDCLCNRCQVSLWPWLDETLASQVVFLGTPRCAKLPAYIVSFRFEHETNKFDSFWTNEN